MPVPLVGSSNEPAVGRSVHGNVVPELDVENRTFQEVRLVVVGPERVSGAGGNRRWRATECGGRTAAGKE